MEERREAIWTVPADWRNTYFILFNVQFVVCLGLVIWHEVSTRGVSDNFVDVLLAVCHSMAPVVITIAAENIVIVEVFRMLSEKYLARRFRQGQAQADRKWEQWAKQLIEKGQLPADIVLPTSDSADKEAKT